MRHKIKILIHKPPTNEANPEKIGLTKAGVFIPIADKDGFRYALINPKFSIEDFSFFALHELIHGIFHYEVCLDPDMTEEEKKEMIKRLNDKYDKKHEKREEEANLIAMIGIHPKAKIEASAKSPVNVEFTNQTMINCFMDRMRFYASYQI